MLDFSARRDTLWGVERHMERSQSAGPGRTLTVGEDFWSLDGEEHDLGEVEWRALLQSVAIQALGDLLSWGIVDRWGAVAWFLRGQGDAVLATLGVRSAARADVLGYARDVGRKSPEAAKARVQGDRRAAERRRTVQTVRNVMIKARGGSQWSER